MICESFDLERAHLLAQLSDIAYQEALPAGPSDLALDALESFSAGAACGFAARINDDVVLVFRGTVAPHVAWDLSVVQWLANLSFRQMPALGGQVHQGFWQTLDQ